MKATLVCNPAAGGGRAGRQLEAIRSRLRDLQIQCNVRQSERSGHVRELCHQIVHDGVSHLLVAGGDGTLFEAINGVMTAAGSQSDVVLTPLPIGTGNDIARMLGLNDWSTALDRMTAKVNRQIDVGQLQSESGNYWFLNGVGIGFDAEVNAQAQRMKQLPKALVYNLALGIRWLRGITPHVLQADSASDSFRGPITLCAISNGRWYGGGFEIAPEARVDDGALDVVVADHVRRFGILRLLPALARSQHLTRPEVTHWQTNEVTISALQPLPVQVDGELIQPAAELTVTIHPKALTVTA